MACCTRRHAERQLRSLVRRKAHQRREASEAHGIRHTAQQWYSSSRVLDIRSTRRKVLFHATVILQYGRPFEFVAGLSVCLCNGGTRQVWDLHRGQWDATTTAMRAPSKCNALDVSQSWKDAAGTNAVVASGHMDGVVRVGAMQYSTQDCVTFFFVGCSAVRLCGQYIVAERRLVRAF